MVRDATRSGPLPCSTFIPHHYQLRGVNLHDLAMTWSMSAEKTAESSRALAVPVMRLKMEHRHKLARCLAE